MYPWYRILAPLVKEAQAAAQPKPSSSALTKHLLNTLKDESNPITHSNIYQRSGMSFTTLSPFTPRQIVAAGSTALDTYGLSRQ